MRIVLFLLGKTALYPTLASGAGAPRICPRAKSRRCRHGAMMSRHSTEKARTLKISLILPHHDRRNAGWKPLESALRQNFDRRCYEVIAVVGRPFGDEPENDPYAETLLRQCDAVVRLDEDPNRPDQEIPFLLAGYRKSSGDVLFFMEGHTELDPDCCAMIAAHFRDNPQSQVAWAPRIHRHRTSLGLLIGMHSKHHESLARARGGFGLGANSVIARELFERLGGLEAEYARFCERVLQERLEQNEVAIGRLALPLAIHYDDMPLSQLLGIAAAAGEAKFRYYNSRRSDAGPVAVRHWIYLLANHGACARLLRVPSRMLGTVLLRAAVVLCRVSRSIAYRLYVLGLGFADLAGFCWARIRHARAAGVALPIAVTQSAAAESGTSETAS
jgi:hypothetical protein